MKNQGLRLQLGKMLLTLAIIWLGVHIIPSADHVQAADVTINVNTSSITMKNASIQDATALEISVKNQPVGATTVVSLENSEVIKFYKRDDDDYEKIELYDTESQVKKASEYDDEDDEDDEEELSLQIMPLAAGNSSVVINVYSSTNEVLATKTIPVVVRNVTPQLKRSDGKTKSYKLGQKSNWTCQSGAWESGVFTLRNIPYGSKVTLSVSNNKMYKLTRDYANYKFKKMKSKTYVLKEYPYENYVNYEFVLNPIKKGTATIKITIESGSNITTYTIKNKVSAYKNPLSKLVINGKDKTKVYNDKQYLSFGTNLETSSCLDMFSGDGDNITGQIKMKKGYKLVSVTYGKKKAKLSNKQGGYSFSIPRKSFDYGTVFKITYKDKKGKTKYLYNIEM